MEKILDKFLSAGSETVSEFTLVDLGELVSRTLPLVVPHAAHAGVTLTWEPAGFSSVIRGDSHGLEQLLLNLLWNATDSAAAHSSQRSAEVRIELRQESADRIALVVADSGPGPSDNIAQSMFEPFVTEKPGGVGLGLSIVKRVADHHGATVHWRRRDGLTEFVVAFPVVDAGEVAPRSADVRN
jgi:C4-dicarboxylate-specific signal transduction histidine kinase